MRPCRRAERQARVTIAKRSGGSSCIVNGNSGPRYAGECPVDAVVVDQWDVVARPALEMCLIRRIGINRDHRIRTNAMLDEHPHRRGRGDDEGAFLDGGEARQRLAKRRPGGDNYQRPPDPWPCADTTAAAAPGDRNVQKVREVVVEETIEQIELPLDADRQRLRNLGEQGAVVIFRRCASTARAEPSSPTACAVRRSDRPDARASTAADEGEKWRRGMIHPLTRSDRRIVDEPAERWPIPAR